MFLFDVIVNVSGFVVVVVSPLQKSKFQPAFGVAVICTTVPWSYVAWLGAATAVPLPTVDSVSVYWLIENEAAIVWFRWSGGKEKFVPAPTDEPFTSTSSTW